jgi:hypothetical protein
MIKNLTIEKSIHLILVIVAFVLLTMLVIIPRSAEGNSLFVLQYYLGVSSWLIIFYSQIFWLFPTYAIKKKVLRYFLFSSLIILGLFLIYSFVITINLQVQMFKKDHIQKSFFETCFSHYSIYVFWLQAVVVVMVVSIIYSLLKIFFQMIVNKGFLKARTLTLLITAIISVVSGFYVGSTITIIRLGEMLK